jgi:hypothetical protein
MAIQSPAPARPPAGAGPSASAVPPPPPPPAAPRRRGVPSLSTTPARLQALLAFMVLASLAWGAIGAWSVLGHASAASAVVASGEPLSRDAQQMYQSLADADVTSTTAFLSGPSEPLASRQRYAADISQAASDLTALKDAAAGSSDPRLAASLAAVAGGLPLYTGYVAQAQADSALGYMLTGGSFIQVASEQMHLTLLPAARTIYGLENAALTTESADATGLPWIALTIIAALAIGYVLIRSQRWISRHTHRVVNPGLLIASGALTVVLLWLIIAFAVARSDLGDGAAQGSVPAARLAQAAIDTQQARGDQILNLISRTGDTTFKADFELVKAQIGPGSGTLLTEAAAGAAAGSSGSQDALAAARDEQSWYGVNDQVYRLDAAASYADETHLVIGTGPGSSAAGFSRVERDLDQGIAADQAAFDSDATAGRDAYAGLGIGIIVAALAMAFFSARGLARRLAEYR